MSNRHKIILWLLFTLAIRASYAQDVVNTQASSTPVQNTTVSTTVVGDPHAWGLTPAEWAHYQVLMQGPNGQWYPHLAPTIVLGINATTPQAQHHFAELVARQEHDKLARELAFDRAVHAALVRLYPQEPVIQPFDLSPFNPVKTPPPTPKLTLQAGDHVVLLADVRNGVEKVMPPLLAQIQHHAGTVLDIFGVGAADDNALRGWAQRNQIPTTLVAQGRITLNHDNGQLQQTVEQIRLPYLLLVRNGESQPIAVEDLA